MHPRGADGAESENLELDQKLATSSVKGQVVNISGSEVCAAASQ